MLFALALVSSPVVSYFTGTFTVRRDLSQLDTVGEIQLHGFPIWFYESAPGYSALDGWHFGRFFVNAGVLATLMLLVGAAVTHLVKKRTY
jgi:hypothetical protein